MSSFLNTRRIHPDGSYKKGVFKIKILHHSLKNIRNVVLNLIKFQAGSLQLHLKETPTPELLNAYCNSLVFLVILI